MHKIEPAVTSDKVLELVDAVGTADMPGSLRKLAGRHGVGDAARGRKVLAGFADGLFVGAFHALTLAMTEDSRTLRRRTMVTEVVTERGQ